MSITKALSNAVSGLTATARGTEVISSNLANLMTPGYARREMEVSAQTLGGSGGGVRIDGITRVVKAGLLAEMRLAGSAKAEATTRLTFMKSMEQLVGLPGDVGGLGTALGNFRAALSEASSRPDDDIRLANLLSSAEVLAGRLNTASDAVQAQRGNADAAIATDVSTLNDSLARVAHLNRRIAVVTAEGHDPSSLMDERQSVIDRISAIVPVQEVPREAGKVALFTAEGAVLLDGSIPSKFEFQPTIQFTPQMAVGTPPVGQLVMNGNVLDASQMRLFSGGTLTANFAIRDELAPQLQQELDSLALELHDRLADPSVDPTITATDPGLFTDAGMRADPATVVGLAGRITINDAVDPDAGGALWRLRSGLGAVAAGPVGDSSQLIRLSNAVDRAGAPPAVSVFEGNSSLSQRLATFESRVSLRRISAEGDSAVRNSRAETITTRFLDDGVDSDAEMQRLLQYEQAYAANARVIQAIDDMMDQILRL